MDIVRDVGQLFDGLSVDLPHDPFPPCGPLLLHDYRLLQSNFLGTSVLSFTRRVGVPQLLSFVNYFLLEDSELDDGAKMVSVGPEDEVWPLVCTLAVGALSSSRRGVEF